jgi:hypothetical protein
MHSITGKQYRAADDDTDADEEGHFRPLLIGNFTLCNCFGDFGCCYLGNVKNEDCTARYL